jgi:hypothetical protein
MDPHSYYYWFMSRPINKVPKIYEDVIQTGIHTHLRKLANSPGLCASVIIFEAFGSLFM